MSLVDKFSQQLQQLIEEAQEELSEQELSVFVYHGLQTFEQLEEDVIGEEDEDDFFDEDSDLFDIEQEIGDDLEDDELDEGCGPEGFDLSNFY